jgi:SAM-dependent methyltransferase
LEWTTHGTLARLYASEADLWSEFETFRIPSGMLEGRRVLDAGCGMGRWSYVVAKSGARYVVGFDLHDGVHAARALTRETGRVSLLKANVFALPFRPASFDSIISIGVLHHTGDTIGAIRGLLPLLRPGGAPVHPVLRDAGGDEGSSHDDVALPHQSYDWQCCPYRTFHTAEELLRLFDELGLVEVAITNPIYRGVVNIVGRRPSRTEASAVPLAAGRRARE